jgi:hypothetical protein
MSKQTMAERKLREETGRTCRNLVTQISARLDTMGVGWDLNDEKNPRGTLACLDFALWFYFEELLKK